MQERLISSQKVECSIPPTRSTSRETLFFNIQNVLNIRARFTFVSWKF